MHANKVVLLGDVIADCKSGDILGISDRPKILRYIERALEIVEYKTTWKRFEGTLSICSGCDGYVTLPSFVDTVLAVNVDGVPAHPRNGWYEFHANGQGGRSCSNSLLWSWDDKGFTPVIQDLREWSLVAAVVEDPVDGDGSLELRVFGETMDANGNQKKVLTIPTSGPSAEGVAVPLRYGAAATDAGLTQWRSISRVIKPVTRGYVKLIGFPGRQGATAVTLGYYGPEETNPAYRRIKVSQANAPLRVLYRRASFPLVNDTDIIPLPTRQGILDLVKSIRLRETNNLDVALSYEAKALELLYDIENVEDGPLSFQIQIDPLFGIGSVDFR